MKKIKINFVLTILILGIGAVSCSVPKITSRDADLSLLPAKLDEIKSDSTNITATVKWNHYFTDPNLDSLISIALKNNQELNKTLQEIEISRNEIQVRKGEYLPFVNAGAEAGVEKRGRYTTLGSSEENLEIKPGKETPDPLPDYLFGLNASWEIDIWKKLRNSTQVAVNEYLATVEGKNFVVTNLIAEIANSYYELLALDAQLALIRQNIELQNNALRVVKLQKEAAATTELAVKKFEAEVLKTQSLEYQIQQKITTTENRINFLVGRYPQPISRSKDEFTSMLPNIVETGISSQLLENRPDIRRAEFELKAAKLDVKVAKAKFYPTLEINAGIGYNAFNPKYLLTTPESLIYSIAGDLIAPLVNKNAIKAEFKNANSEQIQAAINYEQSVLNAYIEVVNQISQINNLKKTYELKSKQVDALNQSISISNNLFRSARADYMEVLMTQRDALESKFDLIETKLDQMSATVNIYKALGGGWN